MARFTSIRDAILTTLRTHPDSTYTMNQLLAMVQDLGGRAAAREVVTDMVLDGSLRELPEGRFRALIRRRKKS